MKAPDRIATIAIATVAAVLVTVAGFALGSGEATPRDTDLPTIATGVDPSAAPADTTAGEPVVPDLPTLMDDDDGDEHRETVTHPVRVDLPDGDDDDEDDEDDDHADDEDDEDD